MISLGIAGDYGGRAHLRFDDTNPTTEDPAYVEAMKRDIAWLGFAWDELFHASDYFETLYQLARRLIEQGKAYVDSLSEEEIRLYRGTVTEPGRNSPFRERSIGENLALFEGMREGRYAEGAHVLRARIDMASPNMVMRDPLLYRILHTPHYRTGDAWHIYPLYDFAHPLSDALEGISHSLCSLEFENNRDIYNWLVEALFDAPLPHQYEYSRLWLEHTVLSKRKLIQLVDGGYVSGWDDPRMPTLAGLRRRGVTPEAIRALVNMVGVTKVNSWTDMGRFEYVIRDDLNARAPRVMAVIDPLRVVLTNVEPGAEESFDAPLWPHDVPREGSRPLPFSHQLWIERSDFALEPPKGWRRLSPGASVRLRHAYVITCDEVVLDDEGVAKELRCRVHPDSLGANPEGVKVAGVIHWLSARHALEAEFRLYDRLFTAPVPGSERDFLDDLNPTSLLQKRGYVEPSVQHDPNDNRYQFERLGYFWRDPRDATLEEPVFNRIVTLKDSWSKRAEAATVTTKPSAEAKDPIAMSAPIDLGDEPDPVAALTPEQLAHFERIEGRGVERNDAALIAASAALTELFDGATRRYDHPANVAKWLVNELQRVAKEGGLDRPPFDAAALARLVELADGDSLSNRAAKEVLEAMLAGEGDPDTIVAARGLEQVSDRSALAPILERLLAENPDKVTAYRGGKHGLLGFFVGQVMRETGGAANPQLVRDLVEGALDGGG
jgi:glutaminyl-tRNA synthetase